MPKEPGHYLVVPVAQVVVGAFGVRPFDRAGGFEALVRVEYARDSVSELGRPVLGFGVGGVVGCELEVAGGVHVWYGGGGSGVFILFMLLRLRLRDRDSETEFSKLAFEVDDGVCGQFYKLGGGCWLGKLRPLARCDQITP